MSAAMLAVAVACGGPAETSSPASPVSATNASAPGVARLFDPQWFVLSPAEPNDWQELNRTITADYQQFSFRPRGETEFRRRCNGCAPWTAELTVYAPGKYDPAVMQSEQPVSVNGDNDGFFRPMDPEDAGKDSVLAWQYADGAWATAVGMTTATADLDSLTALARALMPAERAPISLPLSVASLPENMPLAQIDVDTSPAQDGSLDYGTHVEFAPCALEPDGAVPDCLLDSDSLSVHIWSDDPRGGPQLTTQITVGGKDGFINQTRRSATVSVQPGLAAEFMLTGPDENTTLDQILEGVTWAPDPADEATWEPVSAWTR